MNNQIDIEKNYYQLQEISLPVDKANLNSYLRIVDGYVEINDQQLEMEKGSKVSFNSYFNSFYESYWNEFALIEDIVLELNFTGSVYIEVYRETKHNGCKLVSWKTLSATKAEKEIIKITQLWKFNKEKGRLFVDISAKRNSIITKIAFQTSTIPSPNIAINLVLTTNNDEALLYHNIKAILTHQDVRGSVSTIHIINKGDRFTNGRLLEILAASDFISVVEQQNNETYNVENVQRVGSSTTVTHTVLVRDNVFVDPRSLHNVVSFLGFVLPDVAVLGDLLDIERPWQALTVAEESQSAHLMDSLFDKTKDLRRVATLSSFRSVQLDDCRDGGIYVYPESSFKIADRQDILFKTDINEQVQQDNLHLRWVSLPGIAVFGEKQSVYLNNETESYALQKILLPRDKTISELYLRELHGYLEVDEFYLMLEPATKISFNTYFNSFYESYWVECTSIEDVFLEIEFVGAIVVEIYRDTQNNGCSRIVEKKLTADLLDKQKVDFLVFNEGGLGEAGRIFIDILAESKTIIHNIGFKTRKPPQNNPSITLGICTFNRESYLYRNLKAIQSYQDIIKSIEKIIIVNQGPSFKNQDLVSLVAASNLIQVIEQRNLGGCGGFTRTMYECLKIEGISHHVIMDDDASLDARVLHNLENFLAYARSNIAVGGHMLDLLRPWVLYEAGAMIKQNSRIQSLHHNIDLRGVGSFQAFNKCHFPDYNAWWFCAIPTQHIEAVDFPAPIFIRGDDMEYGIRLQEKGVKTVAMPGIAVWHEPFYVKVGGWQNYYDLRNRLIMASVYQSRFTLESPKFIIWMMLQALALHDYLGAKLICKAIQDFLKGPALFTIDSEVIHNDITKLSKLLNPEPSSLTNLPRLAKIKIMPKSDFSQALLVIKRVISLVLSINPGRRKPIEIMDYQASIANVGAFPYVKTNGIGSYRLLYRPDQGKLLPLLLECIKTFKSYLKNREQVAKAWRSDILHLRSPKAWAEIFADNDVNENSKR